MRELLNSVLLYLWAQPYVWPRWIIYTWVKHKKAESILDILTRTHMPHYHYLIRTRLEAFTEIHKMCKLLRRCLLSVPDSVFVMIAWQWSYVIF